MGNVSNASNQKIQEFNRLNPLEQRQTLRIERQEQEKQVAPPSRNQGGGRPGGPKPMSAPSPFKTQSASKPAPRRQGPLDWSIMYTYTDEAPLLATYSFLPIINKFTQPCGVKVDATDISVAHRVLALFSDQLRPDQQVPDTLAELGEMTKDEKANIIKLPNVSASVPQLVACVKELQGKGYNIPDYDPDNKAIAEKYSVILGSAVNPVLREGNSDRRVARPVKDDARVNPHRMIKPYSNQSRSKVVHMKSGDFYATEKSKIMEKETYLKFELVDKRGNRTELRPPLKVLENEVIDASVLDVGKLRKFYEKELLNSDTMVSLHLKATMMKVSDPIMFGHAVKIFYEPVFSKYEALFEKIGVNANNGLGDVYAKLEKAVNSGQISPSQKSNVEKDIMDIYSDRPPIAMVNSDKGITNLHVPSDVIIDASMPVVIRDGGKMWGWDNKLHDVKCLIPDRCYATMYKVAMDYCKEFGEFDPSKMGSVSNVGLMARKAEEYGSHDKTFEIPEAGWVIISDTSNGKSVFEHAVKKGDIYRMCQAKDEAIIDWISLSLKRGEVTGTPVIFWLDEDRGHDSSMIDIINYTVGKNKAIKTKADWQIMAPEEAMQTTLERSRAGLDTISATGNVLRDYLTDLFPILELGTSAKMLSIVPLLAGGGLYETGAGGSAPKHVQQFVEEGHLRWDSLGEFLALAVSLEELGRKSGNKKAEILGNTLNDAVTELLKNGQSPSRKCGQNDNRGSHFYIALHWSRALTQQRQDPSLATQFQDLHNQLSSNERTIVDDLIKCQGRPQDIGGYYYPEPDKATRCMRPSETLNRIIG